MPSRVAEPPHEDGHQLLYRQPVPGRRAGDSHLPASQLVSRHHWILALWPCPLQGHPLPTGELLLGDPQGPSDTPGPASTALHRSQGPWVLTFRRWLRTSTMSRSTVSKSRPPGPTLKETDTAPRADAEILSRSHPQTRTQSFGDTCAVTSRHSRTPRRSQAQACWDRALGCSLIQGRADLRGPAGESALPSLPTHRWPGPSLSQWWESGHPVGLAGWKEDWPEARVSSLALPPYTPEGRGYSWSQCPPASLALALVHLCLPEWGLFPLTAWGKGWNPRAERMPLGFPIILRFSTQLINSGHPENKDRQVRKFT